MPVTDRRGRQAAGVYQAFPSRQVVYTLERYVRGSERVVETHTYQGTPCQAYR